MNTPHSSARGLSWLAIILAAAPTLGTLLCWLLWGSLAEGSVTILRASLLCLLAMLPMAVMSLGYGLGAWFTARSERRAGLPGAPRLLALLALLSGPAAAGLFFLWIWMVVTSFGWR